MNQFKRIDTSFPDVFLIKRNTYKDNRGSLSKLFNIEHFRDINLPDIEYKEVLYTVSQKDCIRGMHYQSSPHQTVKLISVLQGSIIDVILNVNNDHRDYGKFDSFKLSASNNSSLYLPPEYAHGFKALENNTIVAYLLSDVFVPSSNLGIHYKSFGFDWNIKRPILSNKDDSLPYFK